MKVFKSVVLEGGLGSTDGACFQVSCPPSFLRSGEPACLCYAHDVASVHDFDAHT